MESRPASLCLPWCRPARVSCWQGGIPYSSARCRPLRGPSRNSAQTRASTYYAKMRDPHVRSSRRQRWQLWA
eukprot:6927287-Lingulodinium_polyedra.AAC.1